MKDLDAIYFAARELAPENRLAYLAEACGGDGVLRSRVEQMLAVADKAEAFVTDLPDDDSEDRKPGRALAKTLQLDPADLPDEVIGQKIGRYKILEKLGEGGCGVVYVAEQTEPVRRRVALKVIKLGMDTKQVVARFEAERQALAMMDHPNIAKVLDAAASEQGRPYFVMELVRGIRITDYCDEANLSTKERLDLFIKVCLAIQHAHQKGIIHRDIKPSNILVTLHDGVPVPKVIDFGIAKATEGRLTDGTVYTQLHHFIGTPAYMSPEQAEMSGLDIDTRSDIYSLGVLLYELLAGSTPFDAKELMSLGVDAMRKTIREKEPLRPSTRLGTLGAEQLTTTAKRRSVDTSKLIHQLKGDLDWIVMKCLEKDRARRYDTATGLATDIRRHLDCEPILARPPSKVYEFQKTVRRHKVGFAVTAAIILVLAVGIGMTTWQAVRVISAEKRAVTALDELRASAPAFAEQARALTAREQYADAIAKLDYAIKLRPDVAEYLVAKGDLLQCQLKLAEAAEIYREASRVQPSLARAEASAKLCDELLAAPLSDRGKLTRESLAKLYLAMQKQERPAAELLPVARLLGEEKKLLLDYWLARLKDLPVSAERPLKDRLTVREDGWLALDLSGTKVTDLSPLAGAPFAALDVSGSRALSDLSPLRGLDLIELNFSDTSVADLAPLREMRTLEKLEMTGSLVTDLSALGALRLKSLTFAGCAVSDLTPLGKMPLKELNLRDTRVADLSPLIGMPIKNLDLSIAPVLDFSPLAQLPLEKCFLLRNGITDLSVLRGKPLKELVLFACKDARNYAVLAEIKTLELLLLPSTYRELPAEDYAAIGALRAHPKLRQLGAEFRSQMGYAATGSKDVFWRDWDREQTFLPALQKCGIIFSLIKLPTGTYYLAIFNQPFRDLSVLKGAPITDLTIFDAQFTDLTPIHELKLERFRLHSEYVADLSPLRGMPLTNLYLAGSKITDLSPLVGLPLKHLNIDACGNVTNLAPVAELLTLENLTVPMWARNIEMLRKLNRLQWLSHYRILDWFPDTTGEQFWKEYDANPWLGRLRDTGLRPKRLPKRQNDGTWDLDLSDLIISDLTPLEGARLSRLSLGNTTVADLNALRGMPLEELRLGNYAGDLAALRGMPLKSLRLHHCQPQTDVSPLADARDLVSLTLPTNAVNFESLRALPKLERIGFKEDEHNGGRPDQTAAEFWKEYDAKKKTGNQQP